MQEIGESENKGISSQRDDPKVVIFKIAGV
jgi:hypothetical protein